jgi:hypothetical protein
MIGLAFWLAAAARLFCSLADRALAGRRHLAKGGQKSADAFEQPCLAIVSTLVPP